MERKSDRFALERIIAGEPTLVIANGRMLQQHTDEVRVDVDDILAAARSGQGPERLDQIKDDVFDISIILNKEARS